MRTSPPISILILVCFFITSVAGPMARADDFRLPAPGVMVHLSPEFNPPILKGIKVHSDNPFRFDFILDKGDSQLSNKVLKEESSKLIKYFLASLTIPENDLWVNLSPYEKDRIIPNSFGLTEMGRDLLAEDYMLKQITASLIYPEDVIGKKFWKRVYEEAFIKFGTTNIPVNTFNKVWIVPEKAEVYENAKAGTAYVVESKLKVMLEQDYLSLQKHEGIQSKQAQIMDTSQLGGQIVREIVIPQLTKEVNENKNFIRLRQVYNSLILAAWYRKKIKDSILNQVYVDKSKIKGLSSRNVLVEGASKGDIEAIYQRYLQAFKKGVYNYIKEDIDSVTQEAIPRKYFSGGTSFVEEELDPAMTFTSTDNAMSYKRIKKLMRVDFYLRTADDYSNAVQENARRIGEIQNVLQVQKVNESKAMISGVEARRILNANAWNIGKVRGQLGMKSNADCYTFFESIGLLGDLQKRLKEDLERENWSKKAVSDQYGVTFKVIDLLIKKSGIVRKLIDRGEALEVLESHHWKIDESRNQLGMNKQTKIFEFFELLGLKQDLRGKLEEALRLNKWNVTAAAIELGVSDLLISRLIVDFGLVRKKRDQDKVRSVLDAHGWRIGEVRGELEIGNNEKYFDFFESLGLSDELREKLKAVLIESNWGIQNAAQRFAVSEHTMSTLIDDLGIVHQQKDKDNVRKMLDEHNWRIGEIKRELGMKTTENYYRVFKSLGLLTELREQLERSLNEENWTINSVAERFKVSANAINFLIDAFGIDKISWQEARVARIRTVLRGLEGPVTLKQIMKATGYWSGALQTYHYRTLVVEENMRRVQKEMGRPLIEIFSMDETDEELKIKADFLDQQIEKYHLDSIISGTVEDLEVLMDVLMLLDIQLPPSLLEAISVHAYRGIRGQPVDSVNTTDFDEYTATKNSIHLNDFEHATKESSIVIEGRLEGGFRQLQITGDRYRTADVDEHGYFKVRIILPKGKKVNLILFGFDRNKQITGQIQPVEIQQTSTAVSPEEALVELLYQREDLRKSIDSKPEQLKYVINRLELGLLGYFTEDEDGGFREIKNRIRKAQSAKNMFMEKIYTGIETKFKAIQNEPVDGFRQKDDKGNAQHVYFYQKYIIHEIRQRILSQLKGDPNGLPGVILALEQGLGKTLIALALMRWHPYGALGVIPNALAPTWGEQESKLFKDQETNIIASGEHKQRAKQLKDSRKRINIVTLEFLRSDTFGRFEGMNRDPKQLVVFDESQSLGNEESLQSQGADNIEAGFKILLSGTPIVNLASVRSVIKFLEKNNRGLSDARVFARLFKKSDPESLKLLYFMVRKYTLRIKSRHVFKEFDPDLPLEIQLDRLPKKVDILPQKLGAFTLTSAQEDSIFEFFTNWSQWVLNQTTKGMRTQVDTEFHQQKHDDSYFSQLHALQQIMTFPDYFDRASQEENPKMVKLDQIIHHEVDELGGKVLISAKYNEEIQRYVKRYRKGGYGVVTFYGETDQEFKTKGGCLANEQGELLNFKKKNDHEFLIGKDGRPILDPRVGDLGEAADAGPITPKDYNRLVFQNDPKVQIMITNDATGGIGVTLTAANATIRTNPGRNAMVEDQFDKRINRIDNSRKKYETRHYRLEAHYSQQFLNKMKNWVEWRKKQGGARKERIFSVLPISEVTARMRRDRLNVFESLYDKYFKQGTYDEVQDSVFQADRIILEIILSGFESAKNMEDLDINRMRSKFPGLSLKSNSEMQVDNGKEDDKAMRAGHDLQDAHRRVEFISLNTASSAIKSQQDLGGIDLTPANMNLQTRNNVGEIKFHMNPAMFQQLQNAPGFVPVIINIQPMTDLRLFLGLAESSHNASATS